MNPRKLLSAQFVVQFSEFGPPLQPQAFPDISLKSELLFALRQEYKNGDMCIGNVNSMKRRWLVASSPLLNNASVKFSFRSGTGLVLLVGP